MWRCATASQASDSPYLTTLNNHVGRQQWIYDAEGGTPAEREEVERQREQFSSNRFTQKHPSDELYRTACTQKRNSSSLPRVPGVGMSDDHSVTDRDLRETLHAASSYYTTLQVRTVGPLPKSRWSSTTINANCCLDVHGFLEVGLMFHMSPINHFLTWDMFSLVPSFVVVEPSLGAIGGPRQAAVGRLKRPVFSIR